MASIRKRTSYIRGDKFGDQLKLISTVKVDRSQNKEMKASRLIKKTFVYSTNHEPLYTFVEGFFNCPEYYSRTASIINCYQHFFVVASKATRETNGKRTTSYEYIAISYKGNVIDVVPTKWNADKDTIDNYDYIALIGRSNHSID